MEKNNMNINVESLSKAIKDLMLKEPFYGLFAIGLNKSWDSLCPTIGVGLNNINYILAINPEFWEKLPPAHKIGIIKHELIHIAFFHLTNYEQYANKKILNIAMDLEVNQYIDRNMLPSDGVFLEKFEHLNLEPRKGTRYYYDALMEASKQDPIMQHIYQQISDGKSIIELPDDIILEINNHDYNDIEKLNDATKKLIETQTKHVILQVVEQVKKSHGTIPGEFSELIKRLLTVTPPKFDWKGYIRRFVGKSTKIYTKKSRRKMNKRLPDFPGLRIKKQKHILAAIDTSGSVSTTELISFLNELHHLQKTGSEVTLAQCDTSISHVGKFNPRKDLQIHGRGGTSFQPIIDYYNERQNQFSCLIYFTDGEAHTPENAKGNILWVLSEHSSMNENLPGDIIKLNV